MVKEKSTDNFPIIVQGHNFTRVGESVIFEVNTGGWRFKDGNEKIEFFSRTGAVAYAVAKAINKNYNKFIDLDRTVEKHRADAVFHKYHLKIARKKHNNDAIMLYETRLEDSKHKGDTAMGRLKEAAKELNIL